MPLRTAVHTITVARGEPKEKIENYNGQILRRMVAPLVRVKPGFVVDLTAEELEYLNREAPTSIRKPSDAELAAYKAAGGKGDESKAATVTDQERLAADAAAAEAAKTGDASSKDGKKGAAAPSDDAGL
jgi:hypothetical protein